jgi:hypothetical protein
VGERPDIAALLNHGWRQVTPAQRHRLDLVATWHGGPEWAAEVIRRTPLGMDPLSRVFTTSSLEYMREFRAARERG